MKTKTLTQVLQEFIEQNRLGDPAERFGNLSRGYLLELGVIDHERAQSVVNSLGHTSRAQILNAYHNEEVCPYPAIEEK